MLLSVTRKASVITMKDPDRLSNSMCRFYPFPNGLAYLVVKATTLGMENKGLNLICDGIFLGRVIPVS